MADTTENDLIAPLVSEGSYYFLNLAPAADAELTVVCGGREVCGTDYALERGNFQFYSIEYVAAGECELVIEGRSYTFGPGSIFSYGPGIAHAIRSVGKRSMVKYFIDFSGTQAEEKLRTCGLTREEPLRAATPQRVFEIFENLLHTGQSETGHSRKICDTLLELLLLRIAEQAIPYRSADARALESYQRCREHIEQHYNELATLTDIAKACHINASYLCRLFRRFADQTPYQFLLRQKMNHAAELLIDGNLLIKEVADQLHFADPYHFSRVFKSIYKLSPEQFRRIGKRY